MIKMYYIHFIQNLTDDCISTVLASKTTTSNLLTLQVSRQSINRTAVTVLDGYTGFIPVTQERKSPKQN